MTHLQEAAEQLRIARDGNEERARDASAMRGTDRLIALAAVNTRRMEIAAGFTRLAAIEAGLSPCLGHDSTEDET
jgi:hypothetical protein